MLFRRDHCRLVPSGELTVCHGKSPFLMGKSTISMAIFNSKLLVHQRVHCFFGSKIVPTGYFTLTSLLLSLSLFDLGSDTSQSTLQDLGFSLCRQLINASALRCLWRKNAGNPRRPLMELLVRYIPRSWSSFSP